MCEYMHNCKTAAAVACRASFASHTSTAPRRLDYLVCPVYCAVS